MHFKRKVISIRTKNQGKINSLNLKIKQFIKENDVELTMVVGLFFISFATYRVNFTAFIYVLGFIFVGLSMFLLKYPRKR